MFYNSAIGENMFEGNNTKPWFRDDLLRILIGINLSSRIHTSNSPKDVDVRRGFIYALACIAISVGIRPDHILQSDDLILLQSSMSVELIEQSHL